MFRKPHNLWAHSGRSLVSPALTQSSCSFVHFTTCTTPMANSRCSLFSPTNDTLKLLLYFPKYWHTADFALFVKRLVNCLCSFIALPTSAKYLPIYVSNSTHGINT
jgi:hypothetical protein